MSSPRNKTGIVSTVRLRSRKLGSTEDRHKEINSTEPRPLGDLVRCLICKEKFYGKAYLNCHIRNEHLDDVGMTTEVKQSGVNEPAPLVADALNPFNLGTAWTPPTAHSSGLVRPWQNTNIIRRAPRKIKPCFSVSACKRRHDVQHSVPPSHFSQKPSAIPENDQQSKKRRFGKLDTIEKPSFPRKTEQKSKIAVPHKVSASEANNSFHQRSEIPQVPLYTCCLCALEFATSSALISHARNDHQDDRGPFNCKDCTFGSDDVSAIVVHTFRKCKPFTAFSCSVCPRDFSSSYCKEVHESRHSSAANDAHVCPECGAVYFRTCLMAKHILMDHK